MAELMYQKKQDRQTDTLLQRKSGLAMQDNRGTLTAQAKQSTNAHGQGCGCTGCAGQAITTTPTLQAKVIQRAKCGTCKQQIDKLGKGHTSWCNPPKNPMKGGSHDDGSGVQHGGSGGDQHEKGRNAAEKAQNRSGFYGAIKDKNRKK
jgi:hypothetical protein